jgi:hypothetical protein
MKSEASWNARNIANGRAVIKRSASLGPALAALARPFQIGGQALGIGPKFPLNGFSSVLELATLFATGK